jgi:hypothetical protein
VHSTASFNPSLKPIAASRLRLSFSFGGNI